MFTILQNLYTTAVFFTWIFFARTPFCHRTMLRTWWSFHSMRTTNKITKMFSDHDNDLYIWSSSSSWSLYPIHAARPSLGSSRSERDVRPTTVLNSLKKIWKNFIFLNTFVQISIIPLYFSTPLKSFDLRYSFIFLDRFVQIFKCLLIFLKHCWKSSPGRNLRIAG